MGLFVCIIDVYVSINLYTKKDVQMYLARVMPSIDVFLSFLGN